MSTPSRSSTAVPYQNNKKLTVVNLLAGPGCGKSVLAARLFAEMSVRDYRVELVHEAAKDFKWEDWEHIFPEQDYITAQQHRMIRRLVRHDIDYAVTDTSLILACIYAPEWYPHTFHPFVLDIYSSYDNINIVLERNPKLPYKQPGRNENKEEAIQKDRELVALLNRYHIPYHTVKAGPKALKKVMKIIKKHHKAKQSVTIASYNHI